MVYKVTLKPSFKRISVEEGLTVLDAALNAKINIPHSCKNGSCGSCKSRLLSGQVDQPENMEGISQKEKEDGYILTCLAKPVSDIEIESVYFPELEGIVPVLLPCKLEKIKFPSEDIAVLSIRLPPSSDFKFLSGQYIDLIWKGVKRSYSIANAKTRNKVLELHIRQVHKGIFSQLVFEELKAGDLLRLEGPHGTFFIRQSNAPLLFLAGGTGFAPVKAMVEQLLNEGTERMLYIYWGISNVGHLYDNLPDEWQRHHENIQFIPVVSGNNNDWQGRKGLVHKVVLEDFADLSIFEVYACGSPDMINSAKHDFIKQGLEEEKFFSDAFTAFKQTH